MLCFSMDLYKQCILWGKRDNMLKMTLALPWSRAAGLV